MLLFLCGYIGAKVIQHDLRVISGKDRLCYTGNAVRVHSGKKYAGFYLGRCYRRIVVDGMELFPEILSGAHPFPLRLTISAPIWESGVMIRFIGRFWMEASPVALIQSPALQDPEMRRVVVPLLPTSRVSDGAQRPWRPFRGPGSLLLYFQC